jgi:hypothetical protein
MTIPVGLLPQINAAFDAVRLKIDAYQSSYVDANKRYWQGIANPAIMPKDGVTEDINLALKPTDQSEDWSGVGRILVQSPVSIACHTHDGPLGKGYTIYGVVIIAGVLHGQAVGSGPHSATFSWTEMVPSF